MLICLKNDIIYPRCNAKNADTQPIRNHTMEQLATTTKLYEHDAFLTHCTTTLCGVLPVGKGACKVALAQSIFFAEGGGQPADRGSLAFATAQGEQTAKVCDVHEKDGVLWHTLEALGAPLAAALFGVDDSTADVAGGAAQQPNLLGCTVHCALDWAHRLDSMQQHTGEHILSGILHQLYGAENVGFHIGSEAVRMDTSCPISAAQLKIAEEMANEIIWQDVPIETLLPSADALAAMTYRSKKEIDGTVRIVRIANADTCACCGTHLHRTGQVGQIKILAAEHYKGGERLSVVCGKRALHAAQGMRTREAEIGTLLSAKPELTAAAVQRIYRELGELKFAKQGVEQQLFDALAQQAAASAAAGSTAPAIFTVSGLTPDGLHKLAEVLSMQTDVLCAALCEQPAKPDPKTGASVASTGYCLAQRGSDIRPVCKALNTALQGRGGGKPNICQGSAQASAAEIAAFLNNCNV